jgi:hypothetical protein
MKGRSASFGAAYQFTDHVNKRSSAAIFLGCSGRNAGNAFKVNGCGFWFSHDAFWVVNLDLFKPASLTILRHLAYNNEVSVTI